MKSTFPSTVTVGANCCIDDTVTIGNNVTICNNVTIYGNVTIGDNTYIWDNVVIGKRPMGVSTNYRKVDVVQKPIVIGDNCVIACGAVIYSGATIGNNCLISEHAIVRENSVLEGDNIIGGSSLIQYGVRIGERTRILNSSIVSSNATIGKCNFISWGFRSVSYRSFGDNGYDEDMRGPIIGDNNNVGPNVVLLSDVVVGSNNIIGASALISKSIGDNGVFYGMPAKFVKENKKYE